MTSRQFGPDFIIIGAMKAGTTTLYDLCDTHPQIGMSKLKETDYFISEKNWGRGDHWYRDLFPIEERLVTGEASPNYTKLGAFPGVAERIARVAPDCRFIYIVRDPVRRAESQYVHAILSGARGAQEIDEGFLKHLLDVSSYTRQLTEYLRFFRKDQFLIVDFDELISKPHSALVKVSEFLGICNDWPLQNTVISNESATLAQIPLWSFRLRESALFEQLRKYLPRRYIVQLLKHSGTKLRERPAVPETLTIALRQALAEDVDRFRALSENSFPHWSV